MTDDCSFAGLLPNAAKTLRIRKKDSTGFNFLKINYLCAHY
jgi:hypothetical protein